MRDTADHLATQKSTYDHPNDGTCNGKVQFTDAVNI